MTSLPPPSTKHFPEDSLETKVYSIVDQLAEYLPIANDRNRLGFCLYKYMQGEGDHPDTLVKTAKLEITGISSEELSNRINKEIEKLKSEDE